MSADATVFVAMPVYRGADYVAETLRSVQEQTHADLRVLISVDGGDHVSADACAPFLDDDRIDLVVQDGQLRWAGNMNWLIERCDGAYFCYWQQDDLCAPEYLERLVAAHAAHRGAAATYSDVRWFGRSEMVHAMPSLLGLTPSRIIAQIETLGWIPLRGLVAQDALREAGPIGGIDGDSHFADYLWVLRLAAVGDLVRVPEPLYRKRDHAESASHTRRKAHRFTAREAWIELGARLYGDVAADVSPSDRPKLAALVVDRIVVDRPGRWFGYDPWAAADDEPWRLADELADVLRSRFGADLAGDPAMRTLERVVAARAAILGRPEEAELDAGLAAADSAPRRQGLAAELRRRDSMLLACGAGGASRAVLVEGWAAPEEWGTWNDGSRARIWLPLPAGTRWRVRLHGRVYRGADRHPLDPRMTISRGRDVLIEHRAGNHRDLPEFVLASDGADDDGVLLDLDLPDALKPSELGISPDERRISVGLESIELTRA